jgi:hypothetical protein
VPGQYICVEWFPSGNQPQCDADTLRTLALLGFRDPAIGLEPQIPAGILESASAGCKRLADPSLELGIEEMLDAEDALYGLPCGASDVSLADAGDDWSELV